MTPSDLGRGLIVAGLLLAATGAVLVLAGKLPLVGRLPGDLVIRRERFTLYAPLATSLVLSVIFTVLLRLWRRH